MTTTQTTAIRTQWQDVTAEAKTMTAREMALTPHNLNKAGTIATLTNGQKFVWNEAAVAWVQF